MAVVAEEDGRSETVQELSSENDEDIEILEAEEIAALRVAEAAAARVRVLKACAGSSRSSVSGVEIFPPAVKLRRRLGALTSSAWPSTGSAAGTSADPHRTSGTGDPPDRGRRCSGRRSSTTASSGSLAEPLRAST